MRTRLCFSTFTLVLSLAARSQSVLKSSYTRTATYTLKYQPDSTDPGSRRSELMVLLMDSTHSLFLSYNSFMYDSISYQSFLKTGNIFGDMEVATTYQTDLSYQVLKNHDLIETLDRVGQENLVYSEKKTALKWILQPDTMTVNGFKCQKALLDFGNRSWIAWFDPSIAIDDGPYKFCDLPGLIIEMADAQHYWVFTLQSLENKGGFYTKPLFSTSPRKTSKQEFMKYADFYRNNRYQADQARGVTFTSGGDEIKKRLEDLAKSDNNWIELYKGK
jgi:GLPGLI family protein